MKPKALRAILAASAGLALVATTASCRQLFTTSLGSSLARDSVSIPSSTSVSDLVDIANTTGQSDPGVAKEVLGALAGKDASDILAMSADDKTSVLNLATSACIDLDSLTTLVSDASADNADTGNLADQVLASFDTSVDLTAVEVLLGDPQTVATAPVETIVLATASVVADVADEIGSTDTVMTILDAGNPSATPEYAALTDAQKAKIDLVIDVRAGLNARSDSDEKVAGVDISDLLGGNP